MCRKKAMHPLLHFVCYARLTNLQLPVLLSDSFDAYNCDADTISNRSLVRLLIVMLYDY